MSRRPDWLALLVTACSSSAVPRQIPVVARPAPSPVEESTVARILPECHISAGESHTTVRQEFGPDKVLRPAKRSSICSMSAACIAQHGVDTPGDGLVAVECDNGHCVCQIEVFDDTSEASTTRELAFEAPCNDAEQAERLLKERCVPAARSGER